VEVARPLCRTLPLLCPADLHPDAARLHTGHQPRWAVDPVYIGESVPGDARNASLRKPETSLELTPAGIPVSLRPFFQEYVLEDLDPERSAFTVIERTLAWGDRRELQWLFAIYGPERLAEWIRQAGWRRLPRRRLLF
jgi:hypothetical protein